MMKRVLGRLTNSLLVRNSALMFLGHGGRVIIQAFYFVVIARALGADGYGAFAGVTAIAAIAAPFASLGSGNLLIKHVSRDPAVFGQYWGKALAITLISAVSLSGAVIAASHFFLPPTIPMLLISCVVISDLFFNRIIEISGQAFQAFQRLGWTAKLQALPSLARLIGAVATAALIEAPSAAQWGAVYLGCTAISAVLAAIVVQCELGRPRCSITTLFLDWREGLYFAISLSAVNVYNDIDKSMLARLATLDAAGIYAAAYRLIDVAFTPVRAILSAAYARFFQVGALGIQSSFEFARKLLPIASTYSILVAVALYAAAPIVPRVLGSDYTDAGSAMRWLALLPLLKTVHYFAADCLTGAGYQGLRSLIQVLVGLANVLLNMWLIPRFSWQGAAVSSLVSDSLLVVLLWASIMRLRQATDRPGVTKSLSIEVPG